MINIYKISLFFIFFFKMSFFIILFFGKKPNSPEAALGPPKVSEHGSVLAPKTTVNVKSRDF